METATVEQVMAQAEESIVLVETASMALVDALQTELANALEMANQLIAQKEMAEGKLAKAEAQRDGLLAAYGELSRATEKQKLAGLAVNSARSALAVLVGEISQ